MVMKSVITVTMMMMTVIRDGDDTDASVMTIQYQCFVMIDDDCDGITDNNSNEPL